MQNVLNLNWKMVRSFNEISEEFLKDSISLWTVSSLLTKIRLYRNELSKNQLKMLLEIPIDVIQNDVELIDPVAYLKHGSYFAGNMVNIDEPFFCELRSRFNSSEFELDDVFSLMRFLQYNAEGIKSGWDYMLRIPEVTLRDDVKLLEMSNYPRSGRVFSRIIDKAMGF